MEILDAEAVSVHFPAVRQRMKPTSVLSHEALSLELLQRHLGGLWKQKYVPVLVAHPA